MSIGVLTYDGFHLSAFHSCVFSTMLFSGNVNKIGDETTAIRTDQAKVLVPLHNTATKNDKGISEHIYKSKVLITSFIKRKKDKSVTGHGRGLEDNTMIDADGKTYTDTDSVEPGINIFPGKKEALEDLKMTKIRNTSIRFEKDETDDGLEKDVGKVEFDNGDTAIPSTSHKASFTVPVSFDESKESESREVEPATEVKDLNGKNDKVDSVTRNIEANFDDDDDNKSTNIAKALNNALKNNSATGKLKMWMPGGKVKIIGSEKEKPKFEMTPKQRDESPTPDAVENKVVHGTNPEDQEKSDLDNTEEKQLSSIDSLSSDSNRPREEHNDKETSKKFIGDGTYGGSPSGGFGGISGGLGGNEIGHGTTVHGINHPSIPEGHGVYTPDIHTTHHSNAVAMVPAVIHHNHHIHHVEPLAPVSNMASGSIMPSPSGGGQEIMHGMGGTYDRFDPCHHDPCHDHHHVEIMPVMEPPVVSPAPSVHHKPDIIKVEFVPEEAKITIGNKSNIVSPTDKKAGTVRVQFIPGEVITDTPKYDTAAVTRGKAKSDIDLELTKGSPKTDRPVSRHTHSTHDKDSTGTTRHHYHGQNSESSESPVSATLHEEEEDDIADAKLAEQVESKLTHEADKIRHRTESQILSKSTSPNPAIGTTLNVQTSQGRAQVTVEDLKPTANGGQEEVTDYLSISMKWHIFHRDDVEGSFLH